VTEKKMAPDDGRLDKDVLNPDDLQVLQVSDNCEICKKIISKRGKVSVCTECESRCHQACAKSAGKFWCKQCNPVASGNIDKAMCLLLQQLKDERDKNDKLNELVVTLKCENKNLISENLALKAKISTNVDCAELKQSPIDGSSCRNPDRVESKKIGKK
jgi:hypothetical protein